ncbi:hypothetical protein BN136_3703 [Cronobacter universalis NCTC 9529]|nr:hypothetical protein BN136_3703 [Cronobacter universalis NCTC 9529]
MRFPGSCCIASIWLIDAEPIYQLPAHFHQALLRLVNVVKLPLNSLKHFLVLLALLR